MPVYLTSPFKSCRRPATPHTPTPNNILHHNYALLFLESILMWCITTGATGPVWCFNPPETTYIFNLVLLNKRMHQCLCPAVTGIAYLRWNRPKIALLCEIRLRRVVGDGMAMILNRLIAKKQPVDALILFTEVVFFRSSGWCWHGRSPTHCGEPFGSAAARMPWTLPLMPLPADLECVAPLLLKIAQSQNRPDARAAWGRGAAPRGASGGGCQLTDCQKWWCEKRTMSQSEFCYVSVQWREKTGEARELMKWLHSGSEGRGGLCRTAGRNHHCLTHFYNAQ